MKLSSRTRGAPLGATAEDPDANFCVAQCKQDCANEAAGEYMFCIDRGNTTEYCTQLAAAVKNNCDVGCTGQCANPS